MLNSLGVVLDKPFSREDWVPRLGMTIGAVLSATQFSMLVFADAYVPYWCGRAAVASAQWERTSGRLRSTLRGKRIVPASSSGSPRTRAFRLAPHPLPPCTHARLIKRMLRREEVRKSKKSKGTPGPLTGLPVPGVPVRPPGCPIPEGRATCRGLDHATVELSRAGRIPGGGGGIGDLVGGGAVRGEAGGGAGAAGGRFGLGPKGPTAGKMSRVLAQANAVPYDPMLDYSGMAIQ